MRSFIGWIGGKSHLKNQIISLIPSDCNRYIEVCGGAGWVLFGKDKIKEQWRIFSRLCGSWKIGISAFWLLTTMCRRRWALPIVLICYLKEKFCSRVRRKSWPRIRLYVKSIWVIASYFVARILWSNPGYCRLIEIKKDHSFSGLFLFLLKSLWLIFWRSCFFHYHLAAEEFSTV